MAIQTVRQKENSSGDSAEVPYFVFDLALTPPTEIDRLDAINAAAAQGLLDQGIAADNWAFERTSYNSGIVKLRYGNAYTEFTPLTPLTPPAAGSVTHGFKAVTFQPQHKQYSLGNVWRETGAPDFKGMVNIQEWSNSFAQSKVYSGYVLELPPETDTVQYVIPNGDFTSTYRQTVRDCLWKVHSGAATFFGTANGEMMLVRAEARQRSDDDLILDFGFSHAPNGDRQVGDVSVSSRGGPTVDGHDLVWAVFFEEFVTVAAGIHIRRPYPKWLYIEQIWDRADLNNLGLPGSTA